LSWDAVNQLGQQYGSPDIDYDRFAARWESDPILKKLVDRFDGHGLVIKTQKHAEQPEQGNPEKKAANAVDQMAKSATKKAIHPFRPQLKMEEVLPGSKFVCC